MFLARDLSKVMHKGRALFGSTPKVKISETLLCFYLVTGELKLTSIDYAQNALK